jgi:hypothetical protein
VIARIAIQEAEKLAPGSGVHNLVDARKTKRVFRAGPIEIGIINAHPPFFILFGYKDRISYPVWMIHFSNKTGS